MIALRPLMAVLVALFVGGAGMQDALLLCRSQKTVHKTCCCTHASVDALARAPQSEHALQRTPCCDATALTVASVPPTAGAHAPLHLAPPSLLVAPTLPTRTAMAEPTTFALARQAPRVATGPPIHIRLHALLI